MKWSIDYLQEDGIVFARTKGPLSWGENKEFIGQVVAAMRKNNTHKVLVEHKGKIKLTVIEIDRIPDLIKELDVRDKDKAALVYDPSSADGTMLLFLKNVLFLKSHKLQLFTDKDKAVAWLKS